MIHLGSGCHIEDFHHTVAEFVLHKFAQEAHIDYTGFAEMVLMNVEAEAR